MKTGRQSLGKWRQFKGTSYHLTNLGRPAVFLLPDGKLKTRIRNISIENKLHGFLMKHFGAFTATLIPSFGFWKNSRKKIVYDRCRQYEISFVGKEKIPLLLAKIAEIALTIGEECIYFKAGQYTCLVAPKK